MTTGAAPGGWYLLGLLLGGAAITALVIWGMLRVQRRIAAESRPDGDEQRLWKLTAAQYWLTVALIGFGFPLAVLLAVALLYFGTDATVTMIGAVPWRTVGVVLGLLVVLGVGVAAAVFLVRLPGEFRRAGCDRSLLLGNRNLIAMGLAALVTVAVCVGGVWLMASELIRGAG
jgi:hypothetical protein